MEETKRDGIRIEAGKRAIRFEERLIERGECRILQECLKEKKERNRKRGMEREGDIFRKKWVCRSGDRKNARGRQSNDR
jgi:hypothetical protein